MKAKNDQASIEERKWPPLVGDYIVGNPKAAIAVMTCGSYDLPKRVVELRGNKVAIAGFCETENEGLAKIVQNVVSNPNIRYIIVCGERVRGHEPGQTIEALHSNGTDEKHAVIGSKGTIPTLLPTYFRGVDPSKYVKRFQQQIISVVDMTDVTSIEVLESRIDELAADRRSIPFNDEPIYPPQPKIAHDWRKAISSYLRKTGGPNGKSRDSLGSMFAFVGSDLSVYDLCGVKVGGQRGEYPTVMAGTIFYVKDKIVTDAKTGNFDKKIAAELIHTQDEYSVRYKIPVMVHVVGQTTNAIERYLLFVADHTDSPVVIDSSSMDVRIHGISLAKDIGIEDRAIYNSVITANSEERKKLEEIGGTKYAICLSFEESAEESVNKTKEILNFFGKVIEKPIIDPGVPKLGRGALSALERAWILKNRFGLPTAIGIHNLHSDLRNLSDIRFDFDYTLPTLFGVDINLYGPIKNTKNVLPLAAGAEATVADDSLKVLGVLPRQPHPYYNLFDEEGSVR
jgi:tetrahydromethanopterin S-methyltransferase subunit H